MTGRKFSRRGYKRRASERDGSPPLVVLLSIKRFAHEKVKASFAGESRFRRFEKWWTERFLRYLTWNSNRSTNFKKPCRALSKCSERGHRTEHRIPSRPCGSQLEASGRSSKSAAPEPLFHLPALGSNHMLNDKIGSNAHFLRILREIV